MVDATLQIATETVSVRPVEFFAKVLLTSSRREDEFAGALTSALELSTPAKPRTACSNEAGTTQCLWFTPNRWLVTSTTQPVQGITNALARDLEPKTFAHVDVTGGLETLEITGPDSPIFLSKACEFDLRTRSFTTGSVAQFLFAHQLVILEAISDHPTYRVYFDSSLSLYFADWMQNAVTLM